MALVMPALRRLRRWAVILGQFMLVQSVAQAATIATGILIVRMLGKQEYAYYTIGNSWLSALVTLSDSGIGDATTAIGGRVWQDPIRLGQVVRTAMRTRRWLCAAAIVPIVAVVVWTLVKTGADHVTILAVALLVGVAGVVQIAVRILVIVPRLKGEIRRLQYVDLAGAFLRLGLTAGAAMAFLTASSAMAAALVALLAQYLLLKRWTASLIDARAPVDDDVRRELRRIVVRQWPNEIHGVFQGQISVVLLSFFGTVSGVADLGALNRIGVVFIVLGSVMQSIVLPRYARCQDPQHLRTLYVEILVGFSVLAAGPIAVAFLAPRPILWLLGPQYAGLPVELVLVAATAALSSIAGVSWTLNTVRGWIKPWWINIPTGILAQLILMPVIGVSTVRQVLLISMAGMALAIVTNVGTTLVYSRGFTRVGDRQRAFANLSGAGEASHSDDAIQ